MGITIVSVEKVDDNFLKKYFDKGGTKMGKKEVKACGSCEYFKLLKKDGYGKCSHPKASWPNEEGFSATWSDNSPSIVLDVDSKGEYVYCYKSKK